jgi:hypothetical protein
MGTVAERLFVRLSATAQRDATIFAQQRAISLHDAHRAAQIERAIWLWRNRYLLGDLLLWPTVEPLEVERAAGTLRDDPRDLVGVGGVYLYPRARGWLEDRWQPLHAAMGVDADAWIPGDDYLVGPVDP